MKRIFDIQQILKSVFECILKDSSKKNYIHESYKPNLKIFAQVGKEKLLRHIYLSWSSCNVIYLASMPTLWYLLE